MKHIILILALGLPSCGAADNKSDAPAAIPTPTPEAPKYSFTGTYTSECKYLEKLTLKNSGSLSEMIIEEYIDGLCTKPKYTTKVTRNIAISNTKITDTTYAVDLTYTKVEMTIYDADTAKEGWYGDSNWTVGETRDISGKSYQGITAPSKNQTFYQAWKSDGSSFYVETPAWRLPADQGRDADHRVIDTVQTVFTKA